jgi:hypothetical protein
VVPKRTECGVAESSVLVGSRLRRWVAVERAFTQKDGGADAWNRRERTTLLVERIMRSALPFWVEV